MYVAAPRWQGTSALRPLRSAGQVRRGLTGRGFRGLGAAEYEVVTDPATGEPRVVMKGGPITTVTVTPDGPAVYQDSTGKIISVSGGSSGSSATEWLNENAGLLAMGAGTLFAFALILKAVK